MSGFVGNLIFGFLPSLVAGGTITPISVTYAQLVTKISGSTLISGQLYSISDFATTYCIGGSMTTASTEVLIVRATSANTLDYRAYSAAFPDDTIYYTTDNLGLICAGGTEKGHIYYRKSTDSKLECWYDWRKIKFRRWETAAGNGIYSSVTNPGGGAESRDFFTFGNTIDFSGPTFTAAANGNGGTCENISVGPITVQGISLYGAPSDLNNNIVFGDDCFDIILQADSFNNMIGNTNWKHNIKGPMYTCLIRQACTSFELHAEISLVNFATACSSIGIYTSIIGLVTAIEVLTGTSGDVTPSSSSWTTSKNNGTSTTIALTTFEALCGVINLTHTNATLSVDKITGYLAAWPMTFKPADGKTTTFTGTAVTNTLANGELVLPTANFVANGSKGDYITFGKFTLNGGAVTTPALEQVDAQNFI